MTNLTQKSQKAKPKNLEKLKAKRDKAQASFDAKYPGFYQLVYDLTVKGGLRDAIQ